MTFVARIREMMADRLTSNIDRLTMALCLVPTIGFVLAWHMQADLATFSALAILPALVALMAAEMWMATHAPDLLARLCRGLVGGTIATVAFDAIRLPLAYLAKGAPDYVPLIGQHLLRETIGIAPTVKAVLLGYGFHYLLMGALLGAAYAMAAGRVLHPWGLIAGIGAGLIGTSLPQFQLLSLATGFTPETATAIMVAALGFAGLVLGSVVEHLGGAQPTRFLPVTFLPDAKVKTK